MGTVDKRRSLLAGGAAWIAAAAVLPARAVQGADEGVAYQGKGEDGVSPPEDLMREHGVLRRILLIYDEILWRCLAHDEDFPLEVLVGSAEVVRRFIEDYHEKLEEEYIFPRFRSAGKSIELVDALGEEFEDKEHELFGQDGFEGMVTRVAEFERGLGIEELAGFTAAWTEN